MRPLRVGSAWVSTASLCGDGMVLRSAGDQVPGTSLDIAPGLWGGFSHYVYLPLNAVLHKVPRGLSPEEAGLATPMSNGIQWTLFDGGLSTSTVLIQGPGQQGMCCLMAAKQAGADRIIVTGTSRDARRLEVAKALGADAVIDVQREDPLERTLEMTGGRGVDVVVDCVGCWPSSGAARDRGNEAARWHDGDQGEGNATFADFPIGRLTRKGMTLKSARGHSYRAVELALHVLASRRFPLDLIMTHQFGLAEVDLAIKSVGGEGAGRHSRIRNAVEVDASTLQDLRPRAAFLPTRAYSTRPGMCRCGTLPIPNGSSCRGRLHPRS